MAHHQRTDTGCNDDLSACRIVVRGHTLLSLECHRIRRRSKMWLISRLRSSLAFAPSDHYAPSNGSEGFSRVCQPQRRLLKGFVMLGRIVGAGISSRVLVVLLALAGSVFGAAQLGATAVEPIPEFAPVTVEVQSEALGLSAQEVEDLVTVPLEANLLSGVAWVDRMQSSSIPGLSSIVMTFEQGTDEVRARQVVQERLTQGALLTNASRAPVMLQPTSAANRVMLIGLSSKQQSLVDLSVLSRWTIRPKLMSVEGVANVAVWGMRDRQLHVQADPVRMQQHGVSLDELVATTGNALWVSPLSFLEASTPGRGGFLDLPQQRVNVQHVSPITDSAALGRVAVEGVSDSKVTLADVATIVEAPPTIIGDGIVKDASGLVLVVEKQPGASTAEVSKGIEDAIAALSVGLPGVSIDSSIYRPADYVADAGRNLAFAALLALALLALGSALIYRSWRPIVTVVVTAGLSLLTGWLLLWLRAAPVNLLALAGLAAGSALAVAQAASAVDGSEGTSASERPPSDWHCLYDARRECDLHRRRGGPVHGSRASSGWPGGCLPPRGGDWLPRGGGRVPCRLRFHRTGPGSTARRT